MTPCDTALLDLARHISRQAPLHSPRGREILEATLMPIVRVALRTGQGQAPLVRWVRSQVGSQDRPSDVTATARPLVRRLGERMLELLDPLPGRETVVGF